MASEKKHVGLFGVAGVLVAALIIVGFVFAGNIIQVSGKGVLTIQVMDKPVDLESLWLTVTSLRIKGEDETWTDLTLKIDRFDLLALQDVSLTLSETPIPAGNYVMIKMNVQDALAVYRDQREETLTVPSGVIKVILKPHLSMEAGGQVTVLIDLQPEGLDTIGISRSLNLRPVVKAIVDQ